MPKDYLTQAEIWDRLCTMWPSGQERDIEDLYTIVAQHGLRSGDHRPARPDGSGVRWQRNVQNVLKHKTDDGYLIWLRRGRYLMT